jgi:hypothetical protein
MECITETYGEYTLLSNSRPANANPDQYTATCVVKKDGKIVDRVSVGNLFGSASEANDEARSLAKQLVRAWWRSA